MKYEENEEMKEIKDDVGNDEINKNRSKNEEIKLEEISKN